MPRDALPLPSVEDPLVAERFCQLAPAARDATILAIRARAHELAAGSRAPAVAATLVAALEFGTADLDWSDDGGLRPEDESGGCPGDAPDPVVRVLGAGGLAVAWAREGRGVEVTVGPDGGMSWGFRLDGKSVGRRVPVVDVRRAVDIGRGALMWCLGRKDAAWKW